MKTLFVILSLFIAQSTLAETIETTVVGIERGRTPTEDHLVMLSKDGQVGFLSPTQFEILEMLEIGEYTDVLFAVTLDDRHHIMGVQTLSKPKSEAEESANPLDVEENYIPTILSDMASATAIFKELNPNARNTSQCYNRAEVWSYEEFTRHRLYSKKVFLFFTTKYIRDYNYKWWFHVSPFVLVNQHGAPTEEMIDYAFLKAPTPLQQWTNIFIVPKTVCTSVDHYSDYSKHQEDTYCFVIKTSMYFWQPKDIQALETGTPAKTAFIQSDVDDAYKQGFR